jgi:hypothetical protein
MTSPVALVFVFALVCATAVLAARWLGRRLGAPETILFAALVLAFLAPGFFRSKTIVPVDHAMLLPPWSHVGPSPSRHNANLNDVVTQMAPWAKAVRMAWKEGSLPLRNRWNGSGMALAANAQSAAFSPFTFLTLPIALAASFTVLAAAKMFLALSGASLWLRELGVSRSAAAFGAVLFGLGFNMGPWLLFPFSAVMALLPWALFAIELLRADEAAPRRRALVLLTALFVAWPLCGHPESAAMSALFILLWLAGRYGVGGLSRGDVRRLAVGIGVAAAVAVGLTAFLTIPEAIAIGASNRVRYAEAFRSALPSSLLPHGPYFPGGFLTTLFPRTFGDAVDSPMIPGGAGAFPELTLGYFGIVGAAVAALFFRPGSRRSPHEIAFLAPLLVGLFAATATWPVYDLVLRLPVLRLVFLLRYFSLFAFAGSAIAAFEADRLVRDLGSGRRAAIGPAISSSAIAALGVWAFRHYAPLHAATGGLPSQRRALEITLAASAAVLALSAVAALRPRLAAALPVLLAAAAAVELTVQGARLFQFGDPGRLFPETPLIAFLRSRPGPFRIAGSGAVLFPGSNVFAGLEDIRVHDPVERDDYVAFLDRSAGYPPNEYFKSIRDFGSPALDLLNVRYAAGEPGATFPAPKWRLAYDGRDGVVYENSDSLPRVFAASRLSPASRHASDGFEVTAYREKTASITFRVRAPSGPVPAVVSVVDDGGWTAEDESGRAIATSKAAGLLVALALPAGDHEIRLRYLPPGFAAGSAFSSATVVALLTMLLVTARRRRRPPGSREIRSG